MNEIDQEYDSPQFCKTALSYCKLVSNDFRPSEVIQEELEMCFEMLVNVLARVDKEQKVKCLRLILKV